MPSVILQSRAQSGFPLSIGTGLALETIFEPSQEVYDEARQPPDRLDGTLYSDFLFNLSTLARNLLASLKHDDLVKCSKDEVYHTFKEETDYLTTLFQMEEKSLHFYIHDYTFVKSTYPDKIRKASTELQIYQHGMTEMLLRRFAREHKVLKFSKDLFLSGTSTALVLTHVPWDLLSYNRFRRLDLLESHTGVVKTRKDWNSKYIPVPVEKDMSFLPFMEYLLSVFGDRVMFKPSSVKERNTVYEHMLKKKVHPLMGEMALMFK